MFSENLIPPCSVMVAEKSKVCLVLAQDLIISLICSKKLSSNIRSKNNGSKRSQIATPTILKLNSFEHF